MSDIVDVHVAYCNAISDLSRDKTELLERIKRLEQELMEVKNKHSVLVADVVLNEDRAERIKRLEEAGDEMFLRSTRVGREIWKEAKEAKL